MTLPIADRERIDRLEQRSEQLDVLLRGDANQMVQGILPALREVTGALNRQSQVMADVEKWQQEQAPKIEQGVIVAKQVRDLRLVIAGVGIGLTLVTGGGWIAILNLVKP